MSPNPISAAGSIRSKPCLLLFTSWRESRSETCFGFWFTSRLSTRVIVYYCNFLVWHLQSSQIRFFCFPRMADWQEWQATLYHKMGILMSQCQCGGCWGTPRPRGPGSTPTEVPNPKFPNPVLSVSQIIQSFESDKQNVATLGIWSTKLWNLHL